MRVCSAGASRVCFERVLLVWGDHSGQRVSSPCTLVYACISVALTGWGKVSNRVLGAHLCLPAPRIQWAPRGRARVAEQVLQIVAFPVRAVGPIWLSDTCFCFIVIVLLWFACHCSQRVYPCRGLLSAVVPSAGAGRDKEGADGASFREQLPVLCLWYSQWPASTRHSLSLPFLAAAY